jgi:hypothetical protein
MMGANTAPDPEPDLSSVKVFPICYPYPMKFSKLLSKILVSQIPNAPYNPFQGLYSQHFIFFIMYKCSEKARVFCHGEAF